jgi:hypothetical protein
MDIQNVNAYGQSMRMPMHFAPVLWRGPARAGLVLLLISRILGYGCLLPARAAPADAPNPLSALTRFVGTWHSRGTFYATPFSRAGSVHGVTTCKWSDNRQYLICQQAFIARGQPDSDVAVYTWNPVTRSYMFYSIGRTRETGLTISVGPRSVTYLNTFTRGSTKVTFRTLNLFDAPNAYRFETQYSLDGGRSWHTMLRGVTHRVAAAS